MKKMGIEKEQVISLLKASIASHTLSFHAPRMNLFEIIAVLARPGNFTDALATLLAGRLEVVGSLQGAGLLQWLLTVTAVAL